MKIPSAELQVMQALWARTAPASAAEVAGDLAATGWSDRTVKTLLSRLVDKGAVTATPDGRRYLYTASIAQAAHAQGAVGRLAERLFGGRAAPMVAHLADGRGLDADDLDELERLVRELKEARGDR